MIVVKMLPLLLVTPLLLLYGCQETPILPKKQAKVTDVTRPATPVGKGPGKAVRIRHADQTFDTYTVDYPKEKI